MEILNTSKHAREKVEELRDELFVKHGLKWVVCGARGIVMSVASSSRLQGRLHDPLEIAPLGSTNISDLISSRKSVYATDENSVAPVGVTSFGYAFQILNDNLRDALKFSGDFSNWLYEEEKFVPNERHLNDLFEAWLAVKSEEYYNSARLPPRAMKLFEDICELGGSVSPSDFTDFGFNTPQHMRGEVARLEDAQLVNSEKDDTDQRRKTINVLPKGWLLLHHLRGYAS